MHHSLTVLELMELPIDGTTKDDAEELDFVMPVYNLLEYSSNYSDTTGSLWFIRKMKQLILIIILLMLIF